MAMLALERRFLTAFAEAALGLPESELAHAAEAVERLDQFLDASPPGLRFTFHLALLLMPPGLFSKLGFHGRSLTWRRECLARAVREQTGRAPGMLIDRPAILATVKSLISGSYCELPAFWQRLGYRARPAAFVLPDGSRVTPPSGPELEPSQPTEAGRLLHQRAVTPAQLPERFEGEQTIVIIGTGAAGLAAAHALVSRPGGERLRIVLFEAGALRTNESFPTRTLDAFAQIYVNSGVTPGQSQRLGFIQGRVVGGGTTVNNAGSPRPSGAWGEIMRWRWETAGAALDWEGLGQAFDDLRDPLHIRQIDARVITRGTNQVFQGFAPLSGEYAAAGLLNANLEDCVSCGQCNQGCPYDAHRGPFISLLPEILRRNERVLLVPGATVTRLRFATGAGGRRVESVEYRDAGGKTRRLAADRVILAAGAYASSALLLRSDYLSSDNRRRLVGRRFSCNYASPVIGRFAERMDAGRGIQIGYIVEIPDRRVIIETAFAPPTVLGMMLPHWGTSFQARADQYDHFGVAFPTLSSDAYGTIDLSLTTPGSPAIQFELEQTDWERLGWGLRLCAEAIRRAGAVELFDSRFDGSAVGFTGREAEDRARIADYDRGFGPATYVKIQSAHLQGGNVIHRDPSQGVVDSNLKVHGIDNLWVLDSSVFPAPITLNIQYTTMALARYAALRLPLAA
jgi:choline dehydrogenase-like flavoprotein